ncbi:radical SAM protein [Acidobacteriota bacterium]
MKPIVFSSLERIYPRLRSLYHRMSYANPDGRALPFYTVRFELTYRCNLRCRMCFVAEYMRQHGIEDIHDVKDELTTQDVAKVIEDMPGKRSLAVLTGGELFIREDVWDILEHATQKVYCVLGTNATMFTPEMAEQLINLGIISLWIGLDGSKEQHNFMRGDDEAFDQTISGIKIIQDAKKRLGKNYPIINTFTVMARENVGDLVAVADLAEELGVEKCFIEIYDTALDRFGAELSSKLPHERDRERYLMEDDQLKTLREQLESIKKRPNKGTQFRTLPHEFTLDDIINYYRPDFSLKGRMCTVPWWLLRISPTGDVYPCFNYPVGNVKDLSLKEIWAGETYQTFRKAMKPGTAEACRGCNYMQSNRYIP